MDNLQELILEAQLSKAYLSTIERLVNNLKEEVGLKEAEARYLTNLYTELKHLNLFNAKYFKEFEYEGDLINFADIGAFARDPETFAEVMLDVFHAGKFQELFKINFDKNTYEVKLTRVSDIKVDDKKPKYKVMTTPYDYMKVYEDDNWITFNPKNGTEGQSLRTFYSSIWGDKIPRDLKRIFEPTWCTVSSGARQYFESQKSPDKNDQWFVTYSKKPIEELIELIENRHNYSLNSPDNPLNKYLGEMYLLNTKGPTSKEIWYNYGPHHFTNSPGSAVPKSALTPKPTYSYGAGILDPFVISGNKLVTCNLDEQVIEVPLGVTEIAAGAFVDKNNLEEVILPPSVTKIARGAFKDNPFLRVISATNNLQIVETNAIHPTRTANDDIVLVGVIEEDEEGNTIVNKPSRLVFMQNSLRKEYKDMQGTQEVQNV